MKTLELFCGTKSFSRVADEYDYLTFTVDNDPQHDPDFTIDIFEFDPKAFIGDTDIIWASPPCTAFSVASIGKNWNRLSDGTLEPKSDNAELGLKLLEKTIEIIDYFKPEYWFIENPRGLMRKMDVLDFKPRATIAYCQYGDNRMKPTDIWGTIPIKFPIRMCKNGNTCHESAPRGSKTGTQGLKDAMERSRIPDEFCDLLAKHILAEIKND